MDIYPDIEKVKLAFQRMIHNLPTSVTLVASLGEHEILDKLLADTSVQCKVWRYGEEKGDFQLLKREVQVVSRPPVQMLSFKKKGGSPVQLSTPLLGRHNALNCLGVWTLMELLGQDPRMVAKALQSFKGVKRRWSVLGGIS